MSNKRLPLNDKNAYLIIKNALIYSIAQKTIKNTSDIKNIGLSLSHIAKKLKIDLKPRLETIKEEEDEDNHENNSS